MTTAEPDRAVCSAKGCSTDALWVLAWNNPKIHTPDRRKAWVTCEAHCPQLTSFLEARNFLRATVPIEKWDGEPLSPSASS